MLPSPVAARDEQLCVSSSTPIIPQAVRFAVLSGLSHRSAQDCAQKLIQTRFQRHHQLRDPAAFPLGSIALSHATSSYITRQMAHAHQGTAIRCRRRMSEDWQRPTATPRTRRGGHLSEERAHLLASGSTTPTTVSRFHSCCTTTATSLSAKSLSDGYARRNTFVSLCIVPYNSCAHSRKNKRGKRRSKCAAVEISQVQGNITMKTHPSLPSPHPLVKLCRKDTGVMLFKSMPIYPPM